MIDIQQAIAKIRNSEAFPEIRRTPLELNEGDAMLLLKSAGLRMMPYFTIDNTNSKAYMTIAGWMCGREMDATDPNSGKTISGDTKKGLYIAGQPGSGKSVCVAVLSKVLSFLGVSYEFSGRRVPMAIRSYRAEEICQDFARNGSLEEYIRAPVLCINDIGAESRDVLYMGNRCEVIRQVIEARGDRNGQFTIVTSNLKYGRIRERYGDRVYSRLFSMFNYIEITGADRRIKNY